MEKQINIPYYFNLNEDGSTAVVRLLHTSVNTIERVKTHSVKVNEKNRRVKCLKEDCPLCKEGIRLDERVYIHVYDYTEGKEKVWDRTDKILPRLVEIEGSWSPLNTAVLKITREGVDFPKYNVEVQNPMSYADIGSDLVDKPIAKFYSMGRKKEDIQKYLETGSFPEKKPYLPKEEYLKQQQAVAASTTAMDSPNAKAESEYDPFMDDSLTRPKRV